MWLLSSLIAILFLLETESRLIAVCRGREGGRVREAKTGKKEGEKQRRNNGKDGGEMAMITLP